jgi:site-specific recombinase XerC
LQQFFPWLVDEGEIHESPMGKMHPTTIPETPPPVLREHQIRKLLDATSGQDFDDRRDTAIDLLLGRGCPRAESIHRLHSHGSRPAESRGSVRPLRWGRRQYALRYRRENPTSITATFEIAPKSPPRRPPGLRATRLTPASFLDA